MVERANPIGYNTQIALPDGNPTPFFIQQWNSQLNVNSFAFNEIIAGDGLVGGGTLSEGAVTIAMPNVGTASTYGSATQIPVITTDQQGRITGVTLATPTASVEVEDEGTPVVTTGTLNFVGAGVTTTDVAGVATVTIPGGGISGIDVDDDGVAVSTAATTLNFTGAGVVVTDSGSGTTEVAIAGGGGGGSSTMPLTNGAVPNEAVDDGEGQMIAIPLATGVETKIGAYTSAGLIADRPASPVAPEGTILLYYATDTNKVWIWVASAWADLSI